MKEEYFTIENINQVSNEILSWLKEFVRIRKSGFNPEHTALLVIDMQDYFLDKKSHAYLASSEAIIPGINDLISTFNKYKMPVIFTQHENTEDDAGELLNWWGDYIVKGEPDSGINNAVSIPNMKVIKKTQYDAFYNTDLEKTLRKKNVQNVIVTGVMTHLCCETTIRSAFVRGFGCIFPIDGTASQNIEHHKSTFLNLSHGFAQPVLIQDLKRYIEKYYESK
jgi:nicotinamidase-related amidase